MSSDLTRAVLPVYPWTAVSSLGTGQGGGGALHVIARRRDLACLPKSSTTTNIPPLFHLYKQVRIHHLNSLDCHRSNILTSSISQHALVPASIRHVSLQPHRHVPAHYSLQGVLGMTGELLDETTISMA
jgi:hypothetical protein